MLWVGLDGNKVWGVLSSKKKYKKIAAFEFYIFLVELWAAAEI
jgi:hypothetical protein